MRGIYSYSFDRETFVGNYDSRSEALRAALSAAGQQPETPTELYVARKTSGDAQVSGHAREIIERMSDRARAANRGADRYLTDVTEQEEADLDDALASTITAWLTRHNRLPAFSKVEAISEHAIPNPPATVQRDTGEVTEIGTREFPSNL